jgi:hypothetical protein
MIAGFACAVEPGVGDQSEDGGEVVEVSDGRGLKDWAQGAPIDGFDRRGGGSRRRRPSPHAPAIGRLPLCPAPSIPDLRRSALHRCLQCHVISRTKSITIEFIGTDALPPLEAPLAIGAEAAV